MRGQLTNLPRIIVNLTGKLRSEHGYSAVSFGAIAGATFGGLQIIRNENLGLPGLFVFNMTLLLDAISLFAAEAFLKVKVKRKPVRNRTTG